MTFHKMSVSPEDAAARATRFYRWHIDAALYDLSPPRVTTPHALRVPRGLTQMMWVLLPPELKSDEAGTRVRGARGGVGRAAAMRGGAAQDVAGALEEPSDGRVGVPGPPMRRRGAPHRFAPGVPEGAARQAALYPDGDIMCTLQ
ncbi:hypothetical protein B0H14DRAFT_2559606 [Mycena olivaceomarginata]|nr:hypothetical protein B0H14DRAFT_2559606 [Mycena olivaceomarginata]